MRIDNITMSGNAELNNVWVQLYIGDDPKGNAFELEAQRNVGALAKKVWGERETRLQESSGARDASELNVYPSGTAVPIPNGTKSVDPGEEVPAAPTSKKPLIVIAPKPEQQDGELRCCFCILESAFLYSKCRVVVRIALFMILFTNPSWY
jgi:hypothetical protein